MTRYLPDGSVYVPPDEAPERDDTTKAAPDPSLVVANAMLVMERRFTKSNGELLSTVFDAVKVFIEKRIDKSESGLAATMKDLEALLERHAPAETQRRMARMSEHIARLETRLAALERAKR